MEGCVCPVDVISVCSADGTIRPLRFRMEDEEHQLFRSAGSVPMRDESGDRRHLPFVHGDYAAVVQQIHPTLRDIVKFEAVVKMEHYIVRAALTDRDGIVPVADRLIKRAERFEIDGFLRNIRIQHASTSEKLGFWQNRIGFCHCNYSRTVI